MKTHVILTLAVASLVAVAAVNQPEQHKPQPPPPGAVDVIIVHAVPFYWTWKYTSDDGTPLPNTYNWGGYEIQNVDQSRLIDGYENPALPSPYQLTGTNNLAPYLAGKLSQGYRLVHIEGNYEVTATLVKP